MNGPRYRRRHTDALLDVDPGRRCAASAPGSHPFAVALALIAALGGLAGCAVGPDYQPPETPMPDTWQIEATRGITSGDASISTWWTVFRDPVLDSLVERARLGSLDLQAAVERVSEARAVRGIAEGGWFPEVETGAEYKIQRRSRSFWGSFGGDTDDFFSLGLDASWELDFFGRVRRSTEAADAELAATIDDYRDALVVLFAEVATTYMDLRTSQERLASARANVELQRETLDLTRRRYDAGLSPELDVKQAELNLARTEATVPAFLQRIALAIHRLGVLLGEYPGALRAELAPEAPIPDPPPRVAFGLPVDLIRQRPDIRAAERTIAANSARIGVATSDLYPRFSLLGTFSFSALDVAEMFTSDSTALGFGPAVRWNIFNGGRVLANIRAEEARTQLALVDYENQVLAALEEVENAIVSYVQQSARRDALDRSVAAAQESVRLGTRLYKSGLTDFQNVLDMERSLFLQQDALAESRGLVALELIRLYRALGGGWQTIADDPSVIGRKGP